VGKEKETARVELAILVVEVIEIGCEPCIAFATILNLSRFEWFAFSKPISKELLSFALFPTLRTVIFTAWEVVLFAFGFLNWNDQRRGVLSGLG
jgi:hypothetical protein